MGSFGQNDPMPTGPQGTQSPGGVDDLYPDGGPFGAAYGYPSGPGAKIVHGNPTYHYGGSDDDRLYNAEQQQWQQYANEGVQPTGVNQGLINNQQIAQQQQAQSAQGQNDALGLMGAYAMGDQTPAQLQAQQTMAYNQSAQRAMAANAGGGAALAAARGQAANSAATAQSMNANSMNALKAQEQQNYTNQYMNQANELRGSENKLYGINNNAAYADAQNQMDINKANDSIMLGYSNMQNQAIGGMRQIALGQGQFNLQQGQLNYQNAMNQANIVAGEAGKGVQVLGNMDWGGGGDQPPSDYPGGDQQFQQDVGPDNGNNWGSDERLKTDVQRTSLMRPFLDTLAKSRATYRYKNPAHEPRAIPTGGRYAGVMAQDLERVPEIGHQLVIDTPVGKKVDVKTSLSAVMAGLGDVHERVARLEGHRYE